MCSYVLHKNCKGLQCIQESRYKWHDDFWLYIQHFGHKNGSNMGLDISLVYMQGGWNTLSQLCILVWGLKEIMQFYSHADGYNILCLMIFNHWVSKSHDVMKLLTPFTICKWWTNKSIWTRAFWFMVYNLTNCTCSARVLNSTWVYTFCVFTCIEKWTLIIIITSNR